MTKFLEIHDVNWLDHGTKATYVQEQFFNLDNLITFKLGIGPSCYNAEGDHVLYLIEFQHGSVDASWRKGRITLATHKLLTSK